MRFLLVDKILSLETGKRAVGVKNVTLSEDFFADHFPGQPIMPGALITECLVQLADWVVREQNDFERISFPATFERVKFHRLVRPGDQLRLEVELSARETGTMAVRGSAACDGHVVASAEFTVRVEPGGAFDTAEDARALFRVLLPQAARRPAGVF
jgi:3-hydroxyacyl-[acyl-carrier-protein] dehydratase